jgi:hypothetical protein
MTTIIIIPNSRTEEENDRFHKNVALAGLTNKKNDDSYNTIARSLASWPRTRTTQPLLATSILYYASIRN